MDEESMHDYQQALFIHSVKVNLQNGLSRLYGQAVRAAVIYSIEQKEANEFFVFDTMNLLTPHRDALRQHFNGNGTVQQRLSDQQGRDQHNFFGFWQSEFKSHAVAEGFLPSLVHRSSA